jgi:hypothetical protein
MLGLTAVMVCAALGGALIAWWALDRRRTLSEHAVDTQVVRLLTTGPGLTPETVTGAVSRLSCEAHRSGRDGSATPHSGA